MNSALATDPATGQFGATVPIDSVEAMNVLTSPFLAEYGGFTADVVSVETRKAGDKWKFELNDPLPEFRWRSWHMVGLRSSTPRVNFGGPLIHNRLYLLESIQYEMRESPVITLPFPNNETRRQGYNSLTALDYTINTSNVLDCDVSHGGFAHAVRQSRFLQPSAGNADYIRYQLFRQRDGACLFRGNTARQCAFRRQLSRGGMAARHTRHGHDAVTRTAGITSASRRGRRRGSSGAKPGRSREQRMGTHNLKFGSVVGGSAEHALVNEHPVDIYDGSGALIENISSPRDVPLRGPTWNRLFSPRTSGY